MATKTETKDEKLRRLFLENGLTKEDVHKHAHYTIITRSGIEKIQYKHGIIIEYDAITMTPELCVVKARAHKMEGSKEVRIQTFGSAGHNASGTPQRGKENQYVYYPEMAEKRAMSRAVLKLTGFYEMGVFGEDEADDFKHKTGEAIEGNTGGGKAMAERAEKTVTVERPAGNKMTPVQKKKLLELLDSEHVTAQERSKMMTVLDSFDTERAAQATLKLKDTIKEREGAVKN